MFILDEIDKNLIRLLDSDARLSYRELSRRTKLSVNTVIDRLRKLETFRVIRGYHVDVDAKQVGYELTAIIQLVMMKGLVKKVSKELAKLPNVHGVYEIAGDYDTTVVARFKDIAELERFIRYLQANDFVQKTETKIVLKTIKEDFRVLM